MFYRIYRMIENHTRASPTHHLTHLIAHHRLVAMYRTLLASALAVTEPTSRQSHNSIFQQFTARGAQFPVPLFSATVETYHFLYRTFFLVNSCHLTNIVQAFTFMLALIRYTMSST